MKWDSIVSSSWRRASRLARVILITLIIMLMVRIALPYAVEDYVNHVLNTSHDYSGRIGDVSMRLWQGGYQIDQVEILQRNGATNSPLFSARETDLAIDWRELFHGSVVGEVVLKQPRVNFVAGPTPEQTQNGKGEQWDKMLESLFPFNLNRVEITNGEIHFQDPSSTPPVDIYISSLAATATNLTNARELTEKLPSGLNATAGILGGGQLDLRLRLNVLKSPPAFEVNCGVTNVNLVALNDFLRAYGKFDVERGKFALYTSVAGDNTAYEGYFKVFFENLNVFEWKKERGQNVLKIFWEAVVGTVTTALKNHPKDQLAAKIPISGSYAGPSVGIWTTIATLLQNAFVHALVPKLDQPVTVEQVEKTTDKDQAAEPIKPPKTF